MLIEQVQIGDCEAVDDWSLAQDVNAWSSLGYVAAGVVVVVAVARRRIPRVFLALAFAVVVEGVGSVLYHGDPSEVAQLLHDAALVAILGFITGWHVGRLAGERTDAGALLGLLVGAIAGAVGASASAAVTNSFVAAAVVVAVGAELLARRRRLPAVCNSASVVLVGVAVLAWVLGTSASPLCDADSWAQPHALWHLLSALVVVAWLDRAAATTMPHRPPRLRGQQACPTGTDGCHGNRPAAYSHPLGRGRCPHDRCVGGRSVT